MTNHPRCPGARVAVPALLTILFLGLAPLSALAQSAPTPRSSPTGLFLGAHLNGSALSVEDADEVESGGGIGLLVGWGFNRSATIYLGMDGASMSASGEDDAYTLGHGDLGVRVRFGGQEKAALFYLDGAVSGRVARYDIAGSNLDFSGSGITLGGGLEYFFSPAFALDVALKFTFGKFDEASYQGDSETIDVSATSTRFNVGVSWFPTG